MLDWQDLRVFLAAARAHTLATAGQRLGIDAATVSRRVSRLEQELKATLFSRGAGGMQLTAAGARLLEHAVAAEAAIEAATEINIAQGASGTLRVSVPEGFGTEIIAPNLPGFREAYPALRIELVADAGLLSAVRREVDATITLSAPPDARLVVEPLTEYKLGLYSTPAWLAANGAIDSIAHLTEHNTVGYISDRLFAPELDYLVDLNGGIRPLLSSSSIRAQKAILLAQGGVGVLPCFMAEEGLVRVLADNFELRRRFWLGVHRDVNASRRGQILSGWLRTLAHSAQARLLPAS